MEQVNEFFKQYLKANDTVVLAISGGPDSMALFDVVLKYREKVPINIICAHVNHKVRIESEDEALFVKSFCLKNNVVFEYKELLEYVKRKFSEADARIKRYNFFDEVVLKYKAKYLITAHHGDDLIESILMRIVRGSTLQGYAGIKSCSHRNGYDILRPFLSETKDSIMEYINQKNVEYVIDASNNSEKYTRNRYRKNVLPYLKSEFSQVHMKFLNFSNELFEVEEFVNSEMLKYKSTVYNDGIIKVSELLKIPHYLQKRIMMKFLFDHYNDNIYLINNKHLELIFDFINKYNNQLVLPNNTILLKHGNELYLDVKKNIESYDLIFEEELILPNNMRISKVSDSEINSNYYCRLLSNSIKFPLRVRTRKNGDKMSVKNMDGMKKVNDIFTDMKIPKELRDSWPILVDNEDNILWLPGLKKSKFDIEKDSNCDIILKCY